MKKLLAIFVLSIFVSCSGGGSGNESSHSPNNSKEVSVKTENAVEATIKEINSDLVSTNHKLEQQELSVLQEEGLLTQDELNELDELLVEKTTGL